MCPASNLEILIILNRPNTGTEEGSVIGFKKKEKTCLLEISNYDFLEIERKIMYELVGSHLVLLCHSFSRKSKF